MRARGGATVEMALLLLVLVPMILYAVFLMDAAFMKINLQEAVVSGIWDFSSRSSESDGKGSQSDVAMSEAYPAQRNVEIAYNDHSAVYDDGADPDKSTYGDGDRLHGHHDEHHVGFGAQMAYRVQKDGVEDSEFKCRMNGKGVASGATGGGGSRPDLKWASVDLPFTAYGKSAFAGGGYVSCDATGFIYNYVIPKAFLSFSQEDMSNMDYREGGVKTTDPHDLQGKGVNIVAYDTAAITFDTWALRTGGQGGKLDTADLEKADDDNPFVQRVKHVYIQDFAPTYALIVARAVQFEQKAASNKLMVVTPPAASIGGGGLPPNLGALYMVDRYKRGQPGIRQKSPGFSWGGKAYQTTPYDDGNSDYATAYKARGQYYLGCKSEENGNCF